MGRRRKFGPMTEKQTRVISERERKLLAKKMEKEHTYHLAIAAAMTNPNMTGNALPHQPEMATNQTSMDTVNLTSSASSMMMMIPPPDNLQTLTSADACTDAVTTTELAQVENFTRAMNLVASAAGGGGRLSAMAMLGHLNDDLGGSGLTGLLQLDDPMTMKTESNDENMVQNQHHHHHSQMALPMNNTDGTEIRNVKIEAGVGNGAPSTLVGGKTLDYMCLNNAVRIKGVRRKYCPHEVTALVMGVQRHAEESCPWSRILHDVELKDKFHGRTGVDLKDKWRTLIKNRPELASFFENRKVHRQYRPFTQEEEQALIEGVRMFSGERNIWSRILGDPKFGDRLNERSNVQLKDKFRTMKRAGQIIEVPPSKDNMETTVRTISGRKPRPICAKTLTMKKESISGSINSQDVQVKPNDGGLFLQKTAPDGKSGLVVCNV